MTGFVLFLCPIRARAKFRMFTGMVASKTHLSHPLHATDKRNTKIQS